MKRFLLFALPLLLATTAGAQPLNWGGSTADANRIVYLQAGLDYGLTYGGGFGYRLSTKLPVVLSAEYTFPSGGKLLDDFKVRIGGQIDLIQFGDVHVGAQVYGVFRRYESDFVRMNNFGCDVSGTVGYYRPGWFVAGEFGFDKAIVTHFKHGADYRDVYPGVQDGWYEPATGGNYRYGFQTGVSFGRNGITLKAGRLSRQDWKATPTLPYYATLGYARGF
jgi:hypothetical protein